MKVKDIVVALKPFEGNEEHFTVIGEAALVLQGILKECNVVTLNVDEAFEKMVATYTEKDMYGQTYRFFDDNVAFINDLETAGYGTFLNKKFNLRMQGIVSSANYIRDRMYLNHKKYTKDELKHTFDVFDEIADTFGLDKDDKDKK